MTEDERMALQEVMKRFRLTLDFHFTREAAEGTFNLPEGPDTPLIGRVRDRADAVLIDVWITEEPALGLMVSLTHWSVPKGIVLEVFLPALGDHGIITDAMIIPALPFYHFRERLEMRGFASYWVTLSNGHLYAPLYEETPGWRSRPPVVPAS